MRSVFTLTFSLFFLSGHAQYENISGDLLFTSINKNLKTISSFDAFSDSLGWDVIPVDSIAEATAEQLTELLRRKDSQKYNLNIQGLFCDAHLKSADSIKIYSFGYYTGGTMGDADYSIMQWRDTKNKLHSFNLTEHFEGGCSPGAPLVLNNKNRIYLLLGGTKENSTHFLTFAIAVNLNSDSIFNNAGVFADRNQLWVENGNIEYDPKTMILHISCWDINEFHNYLYLQLESNNSWQNKNDTAANRAYYNLLMLKYDSDPDYPGDHGIDLFFNGKKFVNIGPAKKTDGE